MAEIMEGTRTRLLGARIKVHTILMTPDRNASMEALSESYTALDIHPDLPPGATPAAQSPVLPTVQPRRAYHI
jgi:hypothetical protein